MKEGKLTQKEIKKIEEIVAKELSATSFDNCYTFLVEETAKDSIINSDLETQCFETRCNIQVAISLFEETIEYLKKNKDIENKTISLYFVGGIIEDYTKYSSHTISGYKKLLYRIKIE